MKPTVYWSFGFSRHHSEVWYHRTWTYGQDTMHEMWWVQTLGLDGIE